MINLIVNGNSYSYPQPGDKANTGWGSQATNWSSAVTAALTSLGLGGTLTPTPNTVIDISSTTKGILIPRLTTTQRNAITSPATSLLIFNTTLGVFQYYTGSAWITIGAKIPDNVQFDGTLLVNGNINTNGKALTGDGLVGAPAYSFTNDSNSGLYRISEDKIGFSANGARQGEFGVGYGGFTGNIIQVQSGSISTAINTTNTSYQSTGLNVSITPKYINSKILIFGDCAGVYSTATYVSLRLVKNTVQVYVFQNLQSTAKTSTVGFSFIDSPNSISPLNYAVEYKSYSSGTAYFNDYGTEPIISTIIAMEIQQ